MSFGWSVGDILAALQLLNKVRVALKETGGASFSYQESSTFLDILAVTLQHLTALQNAPLDPDLARNLGRLCKQVQDPLLAFRDEIQGTFGRDLGAGSTRARFLTAGMKVRWALSTEKKVRALRERIGVPVAAIGVLMNQQVV